MKKTIGSFILLATLFAGIPHVGFATSDTGGGTPPGATTVQAQLKNPIKYETFSDFVSAVIGAAVAVLTPFVVIAFIYSGFLFVKAQGNETELTEAKSAIKWSVIGAFILMGAWAFAQIIGQTIKTISN